MFKKIMSVFIIMVVGFSMVACSGGGKATESKVEKIQKAGKIILGTSADYPPYEFHKLVDGKDEIVGFDIEIAKAIADDLGVTLEIVDMKFEGLLPALATNNIDFIVAGMVANEERSKSVDFSETYYEAEQRFIIREEDKDKLKNPEDFAGLNIGAQKTTIQEEIALDRFSNAEYIGLSKITDLAIELTNKKIDGIVLAEPVAVAYAKRYPGLYMAETILGKEDGVAVAVNKDTPDLLEAINKTLNRLISENSIDRLIQEATALSED